MVAIKEAKMPRFAIAMVFGFLIVSCTKAAETEKAYTVMVYLVGSDLESGKEPSEPPQGAGSTNLDQMMKIGSSPNLNIVVQTGGAKRWVNPQVDAKSVQRWLIQKGEMVQQGEKLGPVDMGKPQTLQDFVIWAMKTYPAKKYFLDLWDHGGGSVGHTYGADENTENSLSLTDLKQALQNATTATGQKFELIGFDACLMANLETAHTMSPFSKYLVASEEVEPGGGWDYRIFLSAIEKNPNIDGLELGKAVAGSFKSATQEAEPDAVGEITLSVTDLSLVPDVIKSLEALADAANKDLKSAGQDAFIKIADGRSKAEAYGADEANGEFTDMVDLRNVAQKLKGKYPAQAGALDSAISQAVKFTLKGKDKPNANGLSIFMPDRNLDNEELPTKMADYNAMDFSPPYKKFISEYVSVAQKDTAKPAFTNEKLDGDVFSADLESDDIEALYTIITQSKAGGDEIIIMGQDLVDEDDKGKISSTWDDKSFAINNSLVFAIVEDAKDQEGNESITTYTIPALLNGKKVNILAEKDNNTGEFSVSGAWPGIEHGVAQREIYEIKAGDKVTPMFESYNLKTDKSKWIPGTAFTVGKQGLTMERIALPAGEYRLAFKARSFSQVENESQFETFELK
jgi:hypothetical protein